MPLVKIPKASLLTTQGVAQWLGIACRTVCLWAECQYLPAIKVGKQWRFREEEIQGWLAALDQGRQFPPAITPDKKRSKTVPSRFDESSRRPAA